MRIRIPSLATAFLAAALVAAPAAAADDRATITVLGDPREDAPINMDIALHLDEPGEVSVGFGSPIGRCRLSQDHDVLDQQPFAAGDSVLTVSGRRPDPGNYPLCVWIFRRPMFITRLDGPDVTVRSTLAELTVSAPATVGPGRPFNVTVSGWTEMSEQLFLALDDDDCSADFFWLADQEVGRASVEGTFSRTFRLVSEASGRQTICAYLQEEPKGSHAVAVGRASVLVTSPCSAARRRVAASVRRLRWAFTRRQRAAARRALHSARRAAARACRA